VRSNPNPFNAAVNFVSQGAIICWAFVEFKSPKAKCETCFIKPGMTEYATLEFDTSFFPAGRQAMGKNSFRRSYPDPVQQAKLPGSKRG